jgi:peptide/nickel transport system ATP-binding protein
LLEIKQLVVKSNKVLVNLTDTNKSFFINSTLALVGQSGSGKSLTLKTILQLLPSTLQSTFEYKSDFQLNTTTVGFIPQNPFTSLSPLTKINKQFFCDKNITQQMCKLVGLDENILNLYPSQLSGGQLQRIVLAITLSSKPKLLLLDEPTTALDTKSKKLILNLLKSLQKKLNILMLFVTHDISSIEDICEDIIILKDGKIVEQGKLQKIINNPQESYTQQLINSSFKKREFRV